MYSPVSHTNIRLLFIFEYYYTMKVKTHQGTAKRFKITWTGKYVHDKARRNHLMTNKGRSDKPFPYGKVASDANNANIKALAPYL